MKSIILVLVLLFTNALIRPENLTNAQNGNDRVTICHVTGNGDYVTITVSVNGLNGHMKDGSPRAGHENDFFGPCPDEAEIPRPDGTTTPPTLPPNATLEDMTSTPSDSSGFVSDQYFPVPIGEKVCNDLLVYHTDVTGDWEIFRLGGNPKNSPNLSQGEDAIDMNPSLSPDKRWVAFSSNRDGNWDIFIARTDGKFIQQVTFNTVDDTDPVWSPIGNQIIYQSSRNGGENLILLDVTTGIETELTNDSLNNTDPYWSPDASKVIFQRNGEGERQIFEVIIATREMRQITQGDLARSEAQYSPDGQWISYRVAEGEGNSVLYAISIDGMTVRPISALDGNASNLAWSPNSELIAYQSNRDGQSDIYIFEWATETTRKLTQNPTPEYAPTWYCNSNTVVFTTDAMGTPDLFRLDALPITADAVDLTDEQGRLTILDAAECHPHSSPLDEDASRALVDDNTN